MADCRRKKGKSGKPNESIRRKPIWDDDGIIIGSAKVEDDHGTTVKDLASGTTLEGREKGEAIRDVARSKARNGEKAQRLHTTSKPENVGWSGGMGKPSGVRPSGAEDQLAAVELKIYYEFN